MRIVYHGVDTQNYQPGGRREACAQLGLDPETLWIMAAAQARPEKRVDLLIDVVKRVKDARPKTSIGIIICSEMTAGCWRQWSELGQSLLPTSDQRFFGKQSNMGPLYRAASIFIHGGFIESFGLVLVEAYGKTAYRLSAIRAHGPMEIIDDGRTGFLIERDDRDGFVSAVLSYIDQPELRIAHERHGPSQKIGNTKIHKAATRTRRSTDLADLDAPFPHECYGSKVNSINRFTPAIDDGSGSRPPV